jgi:uncharacterized protein DUF4279
MTQQETTNSEEEAPRQLHVELFIVHPTLDPAEISAALALEAQIAHRVGDRRKTPKGTLLPGNYPDTRWRYSVQYSAKDRWFAKEITTLVDRLEPYKAFFRDVRSTGGKASVIIQFFGEYFADELSRDILAKLVDLNLDLGVECFFGPQS